MLQAAECDHLGRTGFEDKPFPQAPLLAATLSAAQAVPAGAIAKSVTGQYTDRQAERIQQAIRKARIEAVASVKK
jgi:tRNA nucleotidyltransferase (CCA-adding enzyme)